MDKFKSCNEFIKTKKDLEDLLEGYGIETYRWGNKGSKSVEDLFSEIERRKCELLIKNGQKLVRKVRVVGINIHYHLKNIDNTYVPLVLKEVMRIKKENGKYLTQNIIKRGHSSSVGKKLELDEDFYEGAIESLKSKLNIEPINKFENTKSYTQEMISPSYPDFLTIYESTEFDLTLTSTQFHASGYCIEREKDLTILEWRII